MLLEQYKSIKDPYVVILVLGNECKKTKISQLSKKKGPVPCPSSNYSEFRLLFKLRLLIIQENNLSVESVLRRQEAQLLLVVRCWFSRAWKAEYRQAPPSGTRQAELVQQEGKRPPSREPWHYGSRRLS